MIFLSTGGFLFGLDLPQWCPSTTPTKSLSRRTTCENNQDSVGRSKRSTTDNFQRFHGATLMFSTASLGAITHSKPVETIYRFDRHSKVSETDFNKISIHASKMCFSNLPLFGQSFGSVIGGSLCLFCDHLHRIFLLSNKFISKLFPDFFISYSPSSSQQVFQQ